MSLFVCFECGAIENTNCCNNYRGVRDNSKRNWSQMEMHGFRNDEIMDRSNTILLCSECNTGTWHGEFPKCQASDAERLMGDQLRGDDWMVFTMHPLWKAYSNDPEGFDMALLWGYDPYPKPETFRLNGRDYDDLFRNEPCEPYVREHEKVGRNDACPCKSGRKYKKCCGGKI